MRLQILNHKLTLIACALFFAAQTARPGTISGSVRAKGKEVTDSAQPGGLYASRKFKFVERTDYDSMHDFVVYIEGPLAGAKPPEQPVKVVQRDAAFVPHIVPVMAGTTVIWPNEDEVFHNVFSKSQASPFNLGLYKKNDPPRSVVFDKPGEVDVFCSIHANMSCVVLVLENPCFAATDSKGHYAITNVPAGTYKLTAWQERLFSRTQDITVPESGDVKADFVLGPDAK